MYKSDQERIVTEVLAAHIALRSSHQFSKVIILKSPPLQKDLLVILLFYLYRNTLSLQVNQLHCHLHKHRTQAIPSDPYARALAYSSRHGLQIHWCISILLNNIYQYYCFLNTSQLWNPGHMWHNPSSQPLHCQQYHPWPSYLWNNKILCDHNNIYVRLILIQHLN